MTAVRRRLSDCQAVQGGKLDDELDELGVAQRACGNNGWPVACY